MQIGLYTDSVGQLDFEAALDFAFGGRVGSDTMGGAQGGESALKLGVSIEAISRSAMTEER